MRRFSKHLPDRVHFEFPQFYSKHKHLIVIHAFFAPTVEYKYFQLVRGVTKIKLVVYKNQMVHNFNRTRLGFSISSIRRIAHRVYNVCLSKKVNWNYLYRMKCIRQITAMLLKMPVPYRYYR